jgi:16S rRNA (cytosine967-C5)-methyltransferase
VAGFVNGILRNAVRKSDDLPFPDHKKDPVQAIAAEKSAPAWLVKRWTDRFGSQKAADLFEALNLIPPISIRTNTLKAGRNQLMAALEKLTEIIEPTQYAPDGIRFQNPNTRIPEMDAFKLGWFQVQDEAAQLACLLLDPRPGESVLDACAGLGGKTGHIAQLMRNRGSIVALDIDSEKLTRLETQMVRLGVSIVRTQHRDLNDGVNKQIGQPFDRILLDAPCSGLGVLRRNPDAKWDPSKKDLGRFAQRQIELLASLKPLLKVAGILVYAVCSIEPEENEAVIDTFLSRYSEFEIDADPGIMPPVLCDRLQNKKGIKTHPTFTDMDGFYMVRLKRIR